MRSRQSKASELTAFGAVLVLSLAACQTVAAITAAPEEFWITAEEILVALWWDIVSIVEFLL